MEKLDILYEDKELLIVNKKAKLLTIGSLKENERTLYHKVSDYVKKKHPKNKIFIVNRLDKETSGIVVFAKNEQTKKEMQEHWNEIATQREYLAIVEKELIGESTIKSYLKEDKTLKVYSTNSSNGKLAITHYKSLAHNSSYSLLEIQIDTGRKNQIRCQLRDINHPIVGDKKYASSCDPLKRLGLHASFLVLNWHGKTFNLYAPIPKSFQNLFPKEINKYIEKRKEYYGKITKSDC